MFDGDFRMLNPNGREVGLKALERKRLVSRPRWRWEIALFVFLSASAALIMSSSRYDAITLLIIVAVPAVLVFPGVLATFLIKGRNFLRGFTWWQCVWVLLFVSGLVFRDRGNSQIEGEALDDWALFRIVLVASAGMILLVRMALQRSTWPRFLFRGLVAWLAIFSSVCVVSSLWSVFPSWTLYKSCEYFVDVAALAAVVASAKSVEAYKKLFDWTWALLGLLLLSAWIGLAVRPQDALIPIFREHGVFGYQLIGLIPNLSSDLIAELGGVIGVIAICRLLRHNSKKEERVWYGLWLAMGFVAMCLAQGRSGIVGFVAGVALVLIVSGRVKLSTAVVAAIAVILITSGSTAEIVSNFLRRGQPNEELYSLSSRMEWWGLAWPKILDHPFTGYGAFAGARFFVLSGSGLELAGIHSDWVETVVGTGLWGLIPALMALLATWRVLAKSVRRSSLTLQERQLRMEAIGALAVVSIRSIFANDLFWHPPTVFFAALAYAQFLTIRRERNIVKRSLPEAA